MMEIDSTSTQVREREREDMNYYLFILTVRVLDSFTRERQGSYLIIHFLTENTQT